VTNCSLDGRTALVSGAGKNIGRAIAVALGEMGACVTCGWAEDEAAAKETASLIVQGEGSANTRQIDLRATSYEELVHEIAGDRGAVDILVHNASVRPRRRIAEVTVAEWDEVHACNLRGPFFLSKAAIEGMRHRGWGRIIFIGGLDAYWGKAQRPHVVATKLGMVGLARALANETARWGITVNTVVPGTMDTIRPHPEWYPDNDEAYRQRTERIPMGRLGSPADVAHACAFLASEQAGYITGQELMVSGGAFPLVRQTSDDYE